MDLNYYTTRIDGIDHFNGVHTLISPDIFLTPLRWAVGGKRYTVCKVISDESMEFSHLYRFSSSSKLASVMYKITGVALTLLLFPIVLLGIHLKNKKATPALQESFQLLSTLETTSPLLYRDKFSLAPIPINIEKELKAWPIVDFQKTIINKWEEVGKGSENYESIKNQLTGWLYNRVPLPSKYTFISEKLASIACKELQGYLKFIAICLDNETDSNLAEQVIMNLSQASSVCSPTWLEVAKEQCYKLKSADSQKERLLRFVQIIKEELIIDFAQKNFSGGWHPINFVRAKVGKEFGLKIQSRKFDQTIQDDAYKKINEIFLKNLFYQVYSTDVLIEMLADKINLDNSHTNGYDQKLGEMLDRCAEREARKQVDFDEELFDPAMYVIEHFYDVANGKYSLNRKGALQLLMEIGLVGC